MIISQNYTPLYPSSYQKCPPSYNFSFLPPSGVDCPDRSLKPLWEIFGMWENPSQQSEMPHFWHQKDPPYQIAIFM